MLIPVIEFLWTFSFGCELLDDEHLLYKMLSTISAIPKATAMKIKTFSNVEYDDDDVPDDGTDSSDDIFVFFILCDFKKNV